MRTALVGLIKEPTALGIENTGFCKRKTPEEGTVTGQSRGRTFDGIVCRNDFPAELTGASTERGALYTYLSKPKPPTAAMLVVTSVFASAWQ